MGAAPHRILLIKVNQLGDSIVNLPMVEELVRRCGAGQVGVITSPIPAALYEGLIPRGNILVRERGEFNNAWKSPARFHSIWRWIRDFRPQDVLVNMDQGYVARLAARLACPGRVFEMSNVAIRLPGLGASVIPFQRDSCMHRNDWGLFKAFAKARNWNGIAEDPPRPISAWSFPERKREGEIKVLIHPGSSTPTTRWDGHRYVDLAERLAALGIRVFWVDEGGFRPGNHPLIEVQGRRPLMDFAALASGCDLFIGNNSGPMHLCDALNVPLLIFCGPVIRQWDPFWSGWKCLIRNSDLACQPCENWGNRISFCPRSEEPMACMTRVSVDFVMDKALELLRRTGRRVTAGGASN